MSENSKSVNKCAICGKPVYGAEIGKTCQAHQGILRTHANQAEKAPEGWVRMSKVCDAAEKAGLKRGDIVNAAGGDAATKPVMDEVFRVVYVGKAKYMNPEVLTKGIALLKTSKAQRAEAKAKAPKAEPKAEVAAEAKTAATASALKQAVKK